MALSMWSNLNTDDSWGLRHCSKEWTHPSWRPWSNLLSFMINSSYLSFLCWALLDLNLPQCQSQTPLLWLSSFLKFLQLWVATQAWGFVCCLSNFLYLLTLSGNAVILTIIRLDRHLHTPMYFFLSMLSISETCYTVAIIPVCFRACGPHQTIFSPRLCPRLFFYLTFGIRPTASCSQPWDYDRYMAICNPLIFGHHGERGLYPVGNWVPGNWPEYGHCPGNVCVWPALLWCLYHLSLLLWCETAAESWPAQTSLSMRSSTFLSVFVSLLYPWDWSSSLMSSSSPPSSRLLQLRVGRRPLPPAPPTSLWSSSTMAAPLSFTWSLSPRVPWGRTDSSQWPYTVVTPLLNPVVYSLRNQDVKDALCRPWGENPSPLSEELWKAFSLIS